MKAVPLGLERRSPDSQSDVWPGLHLQSKPALNLHQVPGLRTSLSRPLSSPSHQTDMTAILCPPASSCPRPSLFPFWGYLRISLAKPNRGLFQKPLKSSPFQSFPLFPTAQPHPGSLLMGQAFPDPGCTGGCLIASWQGL